MSTQDRTNAALPKTASNGPHVLPSIPHTAFDSDLLMKCPGLQTPVDAKGASLVASINGELRTVDALHWEATAPADARREVEKLQAVDLYEKVKSHMLKTYSKTVSVEKEIAGNTVMENLKLVPDPDEMGLQHKVIVFFPFFEIPTSPCFTPFFSFTFIFF